MDSSLSSLSATELIQKVGNTAAVVSAGIVSLEDKVAYIERFFAELEESRWTDEEKAQNFYCLKLLSREALGCDRLYRKDAIRALCPFTGISSLSYTEMTRDYSLDAIRVLCNIQALYPPAREDCVAIVNELPLAKAFELNQNSTQLLFLLSRLIFFCSAVDASTREQFQSQGMLDLIAKELNKIMEEVYPVELPINSDSLYSELLKIVFNLTLNTNIVSSSFLGSAIIDIDDTNPEVKKYRGLLQAILKVLTTLPLKEPALAPPHSQAINCLFNIPFKSLVEVWFPEDDFACVDVIVAVFENTVKKIAPEEDTDKVDEDMFETGIDQCLITTIMVLKKLAADPRVRKRLREYLMPIDLDRTGPLTKGSRVTNAMIRLLSSSLLNQTRDFLSEFLITLCEEDLPLFTRYVGYGNAAGYLFSRGITAPSHQRPANSVLFNIPDNIDLITGYVSEKKKDPFEGMDDEEMERESERLFVLFDRLNKTGVMKAVQK